MTDEDGGAATVTAFVTRGKRHVSIKGLCSGPCGFDVESDGELIAVINALTEAAGLFVHEPDGCHDDGCPCYARGTGR